MAGAEIPPIRLRSGQARARDDRASPLSGQSRILDHRDQGQTGTTGQFRTGVHRAESHIDAIVHGRLLE